MNNIESTISITNTTPPSNPPAAGGPTYVRYNIGKRFPYRDKHPEPVRNKAARRMAMRMHRPFKRKLLAAQTQAAQLRADCESAHEFDRVYPAVLAFNRTARREAAKVKNKGAA